MRLFNRLSLCEHPVGVRLAIKHRVTPFPGHADALEAKLAAVRNMLDAQRKRREEIFRKELPRKVILHGLMQKIGEALDL